MRKKNARTDAHMKRRARALRAESTVPERLLWSVLRNRQCFGLKFRRQVPIGPYIADFLCESANLIVELDGESHIGTGDADDARSRYLQSNGYRVVRVLNDDVMMDGVAVGEHIARECGVEVDPPPRGERQREGEPD